MSGAAIEVALRLRRGDFLLDAAFAAPPGLTVLFGRSGSGKTSVVQAVAGLLRAEGRVAVGGEDWQGGGAWRPPHRRGVGYVFQDARLFPHMSVRRNLFYGARDGRPGGAGRVIEMLGIGHLMDRRPAGLSGGERSRVALGRALLSSPRVILADEPLAALDEARKAEILPFFERIRDEGEVPILYVSHNPAEVARLATTIVAMEDGRVTRVGPAEEVLADPAVTPLGVRAAGAFVTARLAAHEADGLSRLEAGGCPLWLPRVAGDPGAMLRVRIDAQDVMIALTRPEGISALNVLPAAVESVRAGDGPGALVRLATPAGPILARITRRSLDALGLAPGREVFAVLKAVSVAREAVSGF
ncbi:molybdenum ABC transporter ATP-binding protein [Wenxinia saemankumensis]|uniref:Molybdate transport system ATP-binding protein n=1 Tax=Wenxinia saemankumensis TaxID=1447782 RepID=A0A1M6A371_9RHOB|nr:molybdenum ABC transporter ATP-binding protein [Wenxinia saemankumensis]SHI30868.1 molybdate transport system ATP-binding protein [Wenxinia saemankumensis]